MEEFGMARQSKREYLRSIHKRYRQARRKEKTALPGYLEIDLVSHSGRPGVRVCPGSVAGPRPERRRSQDSSLHSAPRLPRLSLTVHGFEG